MAIKRVFQKEPVLSIAACLALVSSCFVLPDAEYLGYIDFRTLAILFSLMTVMAGLRGQGVFDRLGRALLSHTRTTLQLTAVLVGLCFFSSMVITNDVSLLTFVPFTFVVVNSLDAAVRDKLLLPIVCMQTIAANLGSMLTPLGNPQNLYLYGKSGMDMPTTPPAQYTISEYPVSRLLFASHICSKGFHKTFLPCAADLQSLPFYGYDQLIHTLHMRQIYQIAVVALIVMPLRELFLGAFQ